jgi:hypothetical protein
VTSILTNLSADPQASGSQGGAKVSLINKMEHQACLPARRGEVSLTKGTVPAFGLVSCAAVVHFVVYFGFIFYDFTPSTHHSFTPSLIHSFDQL